MDANMAGHCSLWQCIMGPIAILSAQWEGQLYGCFCMVCVQVGKILCGFDFC